jgi:hypothetical protein
MSFGLSQGAQKNRIAPSGNDLCAALPLTHANFGESLAQDAFDLEIGRPTKDNGTAEALVEDRVGTVAAGRVLMT